MNFDDQPVGQHKPLEISELPPEAPPTDVSPPADKSAPLAERATSKNSKTRLEAMNDLLKLLTESPSGDPVFSEYFPAFPKYLGDTHPGAQEKAVEALLVLLGKFTVPADSTLSEIIGVLVEKGLTSAKAQCKSKSVDSLVSIGEMESTHGLLKEGLKGFLTGKTAPKVSAAAIHGVTQLLANFGGGYFPVKEFIGSVTALAGSTNAQVRTEALGYFKEGYRWDKAGVTKAVETLRQAQQDDLKKQFSEIPAEPAKPVKAIKGGSGGQKPGSSVAEGKKEEKKADPCMVAAAEVAVLKRFGESWCSQVLGAKKWSEKKDKLEELLKAITVDRIKNENFSELGQALKKLLQDPNILVSNLVLKVMGQLAKGLGGHFATYAKHMFEPVVQKCKDKKSVAEAQKCLECLTFSLKMEDMGEPIKEALNDKSPLVKAKVCAWLEGSVFPKIVTSVGKNLAAGLGPILAKLTDDAASEVRETALTCLGAMKTAIGEDSTFAKILSELNPQKLEKIEKAASKEPKEDIPPKESPQPTGEDEKKPAEPQVAWEEEKAAKPRDEPEIGSKPPAEPPKRPPPATKSKPKKEAKAAPTIVTEIAEEDVGSVVTVEEAAKTVAENVPAETVGKFDQADWKERAKGIQELGEWMSKNPEKAQIVLEGVVVWIKSKTKEFKESNQGVMKECLAILQSFVTNLVISKKVAHEIVPALVEKLSDQKMGETCTNIVLGTADSATPGYVATLVVKNGYASKAVGTIRGTLAILNKMVDGYGPNMLPLKMLIDYAKHCLGHANQIIRNSATNLITAVYAVTGDVIKPWLSADLKDATLKSLEAELAKVQYKPYGDIKRSLKGESADAAAKNKKKDLADSLVPRANIAPQITSKLISSLSDPSMKHRQEAKDAIEKMIVTANNRILPTGLSQLVTALKGRMGEPCKNLAKGFIGLVGTLAMAMGGGFKQYSKIIVQPLMYNLADKQAAIRSETVTSMDKIAEAAGAELVLNNIGPLLEKDNPDMRTALLGWIMQHKDCLAKCDAPSLVVPLVSAMQDRSKEIRALAEQAVGEVMQQVGHAAFMGAIQDLKPVVKLSLQGILDKFKSQVAIPVDPNKVPAQQEEDQKPVVPMIEEQKSVPVKEPETGSPPTHKPPRIPVPEKSIKKPQGGEMTGSRSTNDLQKSGDSTPKPKPKVKEVKKTLKTTSRSSAKMSSQSPTKSQISGSSTNTLGVETVVLSVIGNKEKRAEQDKSVKWPVNEVREDYVEKLRKALKNVLHPNLWESMFSTQFKKGLASVAALTEGLKNEYASMVDLLDLFCKWVVIKMVDQSNTAITKGLLEFVTLFFKKMEEAKYQMLDFEAAAILPMLCERTGISNVGFRQQIKDLLKNACQIYPVAKIVTHLMTAIETTKNLKTKLECVSLVKEFAAQHGAKFFTTKDIKTFGKLLSSPDNGLKAECLEILTEIYKTKGESIWGAIGDINEKTREILKKRFAASVVPAESPPLNKTAREMRAATPIEPPATLPMSVSMDGREKSPLKTEQSTILLTEQKTEGEEDEKMRVVDRDSAATPIMMDKEPLDISSFNGESQFNATGKVGTESKWGEDHKTVQHSARKASISPLNRTQRQDGESSKIESLEQALEILKTGDISRRVDALMFLNEKATSLLDKEKDLLVSHCDQLFVTFADVLKEIFDKPVHDIPIRFAKYFMTVTNKICLSKPVLKNIGERQIRGFAEQLLTKLLYEGLEKMGDNSEGEYLVKAFNSTMLKILENCNPTRSLVVLIELFGMYKSAAPVTGKIKTGKLPSLIVKCILKLTKVMDSLAPALDVARLLLGLHEYLLANPSNAMPKSANDDIGIRIAKTIINEVVKIRGEKIWEDYKAVEAHSKPDAHLKRWINIILKSNYPAAGTQGKTDATAAESSDELKEIFKGLNSQATFHDAIKSLSEYMAKHPQMDLGQYFVSCSKGFREYVMASLQKYNNGQSKTPGDSMMSSRDLLLTSPRATKEDKTAIPTPTPSTSSSSEYKAKMAMLRQKFGMGPKDDKTNPTSNAYKTQRPAGK